jgi:hypothetical protein
MYRRGWIAVADIDPKDVPAEAFIAPLQDTAINTIFGSSSLSSHNPHHYAKGSMQTR